jgi:hypothetical protein
MRIARVMMVAVLLGAAAGAARAQNGIYGEFSAAQLESTSAPTQYGATFGALLENKSANVVNAGVDFRGSFVSGSGNTSVDTGMAGLRIAVHPKVLPISPYGELLIGVSHYALGAGGPANTDFATAAVVGADHRLLPHVDWRVIEISYGRVNATTPFHPVTYSTGLVVRLGMPHAAKISARRAVLP